MCLGEKKLCIVCDEPPSECECTENTNTCDCYICRGTGIEFDEFTER
jgi:hypothetical protein